MESFENDIKRSTGDSRINWCTKISSCTDEDIRSLGVVGRKAQNASCIGSRKVDDANNQEKMKLEDRETRDFPFWPFSPRPKWFSIHRGPHKREAVFSFWERSHSLSSTWWWGWEENHPSRMLTSMKVGGCDIYLHRWISQGVSTAQISRAGLQTLAVHGE